MQAQINLTPESEATLRNVRTIAEKSGLNHRNKTDLTNYALLLLQACIDKKMFDKLKHK